MEHAATDPASQAPREPIPALSDADRRAAFPVTTEHAAHDNVPHSYWLLDRLEARDADPGKGLAWEAQAWIGTDLHRLWLRSEGERSHGDTESASLELLYGRSISAWWDAVVGVRQETSPGPARTLAAFGVQGLAPMKFEVGAMAYLGESGQAMATLEADYDVLLTNRLVLQPSVEATWHARDDARRGIASGLSSVEAGLRLRYEVTRRFAPYVGVVHARYLGDTADLRRGAGEARDETFVVAGVRLWF